MSTRMPFAYFGFALMVVTNASAQEIPEFNKLRTPVSPAFQILGIAPAQVERPTMPATFAASVLQRAEELSGTLPKSFAVDVAPYWMLPHPGLTFKKYQDAGAASLYRNFTVSVATTDSLGDADAASGETPDFRRLGIGLRTTFIAGRKNARVPPCVAEIAKAATSLAGALGSLVANAIASGRLNASDAAGIEAFKDRVYAQALDSLPSAQRTALKEETASCTEELSARRGFVMDAATGTAATFPSGRADAGHFSSAGAWLTPAWLGESFSNIAVLRMRWDDLDGDTTSTSFDAGVRSVYAFERYAASVEVVNRLTSRAGESKDLVRFGVTFDAKVGSDVWLNVSLGKEFDASKPQSLRALLGFQWQLGDRAVQPDR